MKAEKTRQTIVLPGASGAEPIATAARIGNLLCTSGIPGIDLATGKLGDGPEAQFDLAFRNVRTLIERAGLSTDEIAHLTVFIPGQSHRQYINKPWLEIFPGDDRPARKTTHAGLPEGQEVQLQVFAVPGGRRQPLEIPGIAHRDPLPMGVKIDNFIFSSVLGPDIPGSDQRPEGNDQIVQTFKNVEELVKIGGGTKDDLGLVWVYLGNFDYQPFMVDAWVDMFPQDGDRPSRKTFPYDLGGRTTLIQAQMIAVLGGGRRSNYEVPGIGHHDPIPLGNRKGDYFFSSGITGTSPGTGKLADGAEAQMEQSLENLRLLMQEVGGSLDNLVHITTLLADQKYAAPVKAAWDKIYPNPENRPALHMMQLGLPGRDTLAQIHAIGVL